jgi:CO/xanthine dehydrogenase Mo-binding subunit
MIAHCKRDPAVVEYKSGATRDGKLSAIEARIIFDSGAYANRGPFTLWRATMHASGPYEVPNARVEGYLVYTNKVFQRSFRGFGNLAGLACTKCCITSYTVCRVSVPLLVCAPG